MAQNKVVSIVEQAVQKVKKNKTVVKAAQTTKKVVKKTRAALTDEYFNRTHLKKARENLKKVPGFKQVIEFNDTYRPLTLPTRVLWFVAKKNRFVPDKKWMDTFLKRYEETETYEWSKNYCNKKQKNANLSAILKKVDKLN